MFLRCGETRGTRLALFAGVLFFAGCDSAASVVSCIERPDICGSAGECDPETRQCRRKSGAPCVSSEQCNLPERPVCNGALCVPCDMLQTPEAADEACLSKNRKGVSACVRQGVKKGMCSECRLDEQCGRDKPVCDTASSACRACQKHSECAKSGVCNLGGGLVDLPDVSLGTCVPSERVVFVDADHCPPSGSATGSRDKPFCEIVSALGKADFVVAKPRTSGLYQGVRVSDGKRYAVVGNERDSQTPVQLASSSVSGAKTVLLLSDVTIRGDTVGAKCQSDGNLSLLRSVAQDALVGVDSTGCNKLVVEQSVLSSNRTVGLRIGTGTRSFRLVNSLFIGNGQTAAGVGVSIASGTTGLFAFNTLLSNGEPGQDGGAVRCETGGTVRRILLNSIVLQNGMSSRVDGSGQPLGTQFGGDCVLSHLVVGIDGTVVVPPSEALIRAIPDLDSNFRLLNTPNNRMYVIDKGVVSESVWNDHFGSVRPKGDGYDIGVHELR